MTEMKKKIVVVGNGMVSYKFCEKFINSPGCNAFDIIVYGEEPRPAYDRVHLSEFFTSKNAESLLLADKSWYAKNHIDLRTAELVTSIDPFKNELTTHKGGHETFDYLVLATGSKPFVPPLEGLEKEGIFVYRTIEDLKQIMEYATSVKKAAVMGGGLLGLEAAKALLDMSLETYVIEYNNRIMPRQLDEDGSKILLDTLTSIGMNILLGKQTKTILGNQKITGLSFTDDSRLEVPLLIISAGIRPRDELAPGAMLVKGPRGGFEVNPFMQTNFQHIYAIGEAASVNGDLYGLIAPGYEMADVAVKHILGADCQGFTGSDLSAKLKLAGVDVASFGAPTGSETDIPIVYKNEKKKIYKRINITEDGQYITGGILIGDATEYNQFLQMVKNKAILPPEPEDLILGSRSGATAGGGLHDLPDTAQICSCENVTKSTLVKAIHEGADNLNKIKKETKACTGCAGCVPMVNDLIKITMESAGVAIKNHICEHFPYSRQQLYDIIKINNIDSFNQLIAHHGSGDGCEVCKPVVASLLASIWNDLILKQDTIQDSNDRFLANIQKGGSYSVVPRIPGGEITPEKLIVIGQVAQKYNLYTKITGGQRIDLFGARIDQLPLIWEELIAAGFESGHAYGKALRTIKSCVGSTWCRYGVQDSVSFALEIENRYKGLRAPHKLKGAVSGCIRECAEAQSKDFGIIATEKGWNLYVCGNGGSKPQHAILLANDISKEDCIRYIDRFLMYYIKTAEPLTRTATWLNKLQGGIQYLKEVVVDDALGIGDQLEEEMQQLINNYKCEWKEAINDPSIRSKFKHFVNTEIADPELEFQDMRNQRIPAKW